MAIKFFYSKDSEETHIMHSKSENIEVMMGNKTNEIIEELFDSFLQRPQKSLELSMRRIEFVFDSVNSLYYKLHKISLNRSGSYIDSPKAKKQISNNKSKK